MIRPRPPCAVLAVLMASGMAAGAACGDNSKECGDGTVAEDGVCVPGDPEPPTCTGGTILDEVSNTCVIDEAACQDGTVLIAGACKDPTAGLTVDVIEGLEPNGFGIGGEVSTTPAGLFALEPVGQGGVILKGNIAPRADRDADGEPEPDFDTYLVDVTGPTLLDVSVDGVHGLAGGFVASAESSSLAGWERSGVNLTGDTARRQLYLPSAGRYRISIADTRSLVVGAAVGDATAAYFATIEQLAIPTASQLTPSAGVAQSAGTLASGVPQLFSIDLGNGQNELELSTANEGFIGGLVLAVGDGVRAHASETKGAVAAPALLVASGLAAGTPAIIAVDAVTATTTQPVTFVLDVRVGSL